MDLHLSSGRAFQWQVRWLIAACLVLAAGCSGNDDGDTPDASATGLRDAAVDGGRGGGGGRGGAGAGGGGAEDGGGSGQDGGMDVDGSTPTGDAAVVLPPAAECGRFGDACSAGADCCSGLCDPQTDTCSSSLVQCAADGDACASPTDCCTLSCLPGGDCGVNACLSDDEACAHDTECCSQRCVDDTCQPLNLACKTAGNACSDSDECCSRLCQNDTCQLASSFCIQQGDLCTRATDCCTGRCEIADGASAGICGAPPTGASFCNDGIEGSICGDCNECCSRLCAPYGPTGVNICQPASGCHVTGDFCRGDRDCCGADGTGLPGEGNVSCEKEPDSDLGVCRNPLSCNPQGNVCHYMNYMCDNSAARANCCGGLGAMGGVCQLDGLGVPRCNGLGETCRPTGDTCASADDCCDDRPCVPDQDGVLRCTGDTCVPSDGGCTINADCCPGTTCVRAIGSTMGSCSPTDPPEGGTGGTGGAGGTGGSGACSEYGQTCETGDDCCNDVPCDDGICRVPFG